jgi:hypothetical protein
MRLVFALNCVTALLVGCATPQKITGVVTDSNGRPERGSVIRVHWNHRKLTNTDLPILVSHQTDEHGSFSLDDPELPDFIEAESSDVKRYGVLYSVSWSRNVVVVQ